MFTQAKRRRLRRRTKDKGGPERPTFDKGVLANRREDSHLLATSCKVDTSKLGITQPTKVNLPYEPPKDIKDKDRVWKDYLKEAAEEDTNMLDSWNSDLETLLVFSGLFSAILTAFLIESHKDLKPDPSYAIASAIHDGFRLYNTGYPPVLAGNQDKGFLPSPRNVRINTLWFTSLALSLSSAAGAMLAKSWLVAYSRKPSVGSLVQKAETRQRRIDGLRKWRLQTTLDLLPFLLFVSIILFGFGLCDFLNGLHRSIALAPITVFSSVLCLLLIVTLMRLFVSDSPYHIPTPAAIKIPSAENLKETSANLRRVCGAITERLKRSKMEAWYLVSWCEPQLWMVLTLMLRSLAWGILLLVLSSLRGLVTVLHFLTSLHEEWQRLSGGDYGWKARALSWVIESSSEDAVVKNAIKLIPAAARTKVAIPGSLFTEQVFNIITQQFLSTYDETLIGSNESGAMTSGADEELRTIGYSLGLFLTHRQDILMDAHEDAPPFDTRRLEGALYSRRSHDPSLQLLLSSLTGSFAFDGGEWEADVRWAASPGSKVEDWLRLLVIQDVGHAKVKDGVVLGIAERLSLVCGLMRPVMTTLESSTSFLCVIMQCFRWSRITRYAILVKYNDDSNQAFLTEFASLLSACLRWAMEMFNHHLSRGSRSETLQAYIDASTILLKILQLFLNEIEPSAQPIPTTRVFVHWVATSPHFPIHTRKDVFKILAKLPKYYIFGWEMDAIKRCWEIVSHSGEDADEDHATVSAVTVATTLTSERRLDGQRLLVDALTNDPRLAPSLVSLLGRKTESWKLCARLCRDVLSDVIHLDCYQGTDLLRIEPLHDYPTNESFDLTRQILLKLLDARLEDSLWSLLTRGGKGTVQDVAKLIQTIAAFPDLAKKLISKAKFLAQLTSDAKRRSWGVHARQQFVHIILQLCYQARELSNDDERAAWFSDLVEHRFLHAFAELLSDVSWMGGMLWDIHCFIPIIPNFLKNHTLQVAESKVLDAIDAYLVEMDNGGREILPKDPEVYPPIRPSELLKALREIRRRIDQNSVPTMLTKV